MGERAWYIWDSLVLRGEGHGLQSRSVIYPQSKTAMSEKKG